MNSFLQRVPQSVPFEDLLGYDPSMEQAMRDVSGGYESPVFISGSRLLLALAEIFTVQMLNARSNEHDSFDKGMVAGLLLAASLPSECNQFVKSTQQQEGPPQ